jgi:alkaline phosphatase D
MDRRQFIRSASLAPLILVAPSSLLRAAPAGRVFRHGVASGDPLQDRVILWSHLTVPGGSQTIEVEWAVATDPAFRQIIRRGHAAAEPARDYCVKVDADGLEPGRRYWYRFLALGEVSPVGRTRTLPLGEVASLAFGVASCSNFPAGFFNAYRDMASQDDLDAVIHLGDYIYEYGVEGYASHRAAELGRISVPGHEIVSLDDYRTRHAQYKTDPDLQALHAAHPMIALWDDHEVTNDAWRGGAENHDPSEGDWARRRRNAWRAYEEWMPVRAPGLGDDGRLYRSFEFGSLATLAMVDTRFDDRDQQIDALAFVDRPAEFEAQRRDPARRLISEAQEDWLEQRLARPSRWQLVGQQVLVSELLLPDLSGVLDVELARQRLGPERVEAVLAQGGTGMPMLMDTWDGYVAARDRLLKMLERQASSPVILTGDIHTSIAADLPAADGSGAPIGVELVTTAISSPGFEPYLPTREQGQLAEAFGAANPHFRYMDTHYRGWLRIDLDQDACRATWRHVERVDRRGARAFDGHRLSTANREDGREGFGLRPS